MTNEIKYIGVRAYQCMSYNPTTLGISVQEAGYLEKVVNEAQAVRVEKRHASATDHADNKAL